jgi:hypothetical protein
LSPEKHETLEPDSEQKQEQIQSQTVTSKIYLAATQSAKQQGSHTLTLSTQSLHQELKDESGAVFATLYFLCDLRMGPKS